MAYYSSGNSFGSSSPVVINLIIINALVFLAQYVFRSPLVSEDLSMKLALFPMDSPYFEPYQLITHMFAHGGISHIAFNMLNLYMFGSILEKAWGAKRFFIFYFACGLAAAFAQMLIVKGGPSLGASGAVMGLFAAFAYLYPNTELFLFIIPIPVKAKYMVGIMAALDLFGAFGQVSSGIAHWAHLGGLVMGFVLVIIWNKTNKKTFY